jgi:hypothetical protein
MDVRNAFAGLVLIEVEAVIVGVAALGMLLNRLFLRGLRITEIATYRADMSEEATAQSRALLVQFGRVLETMVQAMVKQKGAARRKIQLPPLYSVNQRFVGTDIEGPYQRMQTILSLREATHEDSGSHEAQQTMADLDALLRSLDMIVRHTQMSGGHKFVDTGELTNGTLRFASPRAKALVERLAVILKTRSQVLVEHQRLLSQWMQSQSVSATIPQLDPRLFDGELAPLAQWIAAQWQLSHPVPSTMSNIYAPLSSAPAPMPVPPRSIPRSSPLAQQPLTLGDVHWPSLDFPPASPPAGTIQPSHIDVHSLIDPESLPAAFRSGGGVESEERGRR